MPVLRCFFNVLCSDLAACRDFYTQLLGLRVRFSSDWFVHLAADDKLELGLLRNDAEIIPEALRVPEAETTQRPGLLTFVVNDVDALHERAKQRGDEIVERPRNLFYGQRRLLLRDPAGTLVDISSECSPDPSWLARVKAAEDGSYHEG